MEKIQSPPNAAPVCLVEDHSRGALKPSDPPSNVNAAPSQSHTVNGQGGLSLMPALRQTTHIAWLLLEDRCRSTLRSRLGRKLLSRKESEKRGRVFIKGSGAEGQYCPLSGVGAALLFHSRNTICCTHFTRNMYGLQYFKEWLEFHPQMNP